MDIRILELIAGAKRAAGLTVIIDVFRAFSLECFLFAQGAEAIYPIGSMEEAFAMKAAHPDMLLFGERKGAKVDGCDYGNSPSSVEGVDFTGKSIIHSTSAGTQGIVGATDAAEIITGSLVNAQAVSAYIRKKNPAVVSLVAMGNAGTERALEDVVCALYLKSLLEERPFPVERECESLRDTGGAHFFDPGRQHIYPEKDFHLCVQADRFDFVIGVVKDSAGRYVNRVIR